MQIKFIPFIGIVFGILLAVGLNCNDDKGHLFGFHVLVVNLRSYDCGNGRVIVYL